MSNVFYNIISILLGALLVYYGIQCIVKKKRIAFIILTFIHGALFMGFGIYGFFIPKEYEFLTILSMLAFSITMIICILLLNKKEEQTKKTI